MKDQVTTIEQSQRLIPVGRAVDMNTLDENPYEE